ncbi:MAG: hypothetical protein IJB88_00040 [Clostridia bacterium]|nr:hypothetical protein [Clostridia bacterium]
MKQHIKIFAVFLCLLFVLTALGGCDKKLPEGIDLAETKKSCKAMLDALIMDDKEAAEALMSETVDPADFDSFYDILVRYFKDNGPYTLKVLDVSQEEHQGNVYVNVTYEAKLSDGHAYIVTCAVTEEEEGLAGIQIQENLINDTPLGLRIAFLVGSLLMIALTVWMVIDCIIRKPDGMGLWIVLMLCTVKLSFAASFGETSFEWGIGLVLSLSTVGTGSYSSVINLALPVGAIVYFFLRKRLPSKKNVPQPSDTIEGTCTELPAEEPKEPDED